MDISQNFIPESVRRIHLIAVCGTAMGALACMLKDLGYEDTGSDQKAYPPQRTCDVRRRRAHARLRNARTG